AGHAFSERATGPDMFRRTAHQQVGETEAGISEQVCAYVAVLSKVLGDAQSQDGRADDRENKDRLLAGPDDGIGANMTQCPSVWLLDLGRGERAGSLGRVRRGP